MRIAAIVLGVLGGFFELLATNPGSVMTTTDFAALSCWVTFGAGGLAASCFAVVAGRKTKAPISVA